MGVAHGGEDAAIAMTKDYKNGFVGLLDLGLYSEKPGKLNE